MSSFKIYGMDFGFGTMLSISLSPFRHCRFTLLIIGVNEVSNNSIIFYDEFSLSVIITYLPLPAFAQP
jgi:hypothetical protein